VTNASAASAPPLPERKPVEVAGAFLVEVEEPPEAEALNPLTPARETTPAKTSGKKSRPIVAKTEAADTEAKEEKARTDPGTKAAPSHLEAATMVSEKIVAPSIPPSPPKMTGPPAPVIAKPNIVQNVVPWVGRNVRPIGIGIAALLAVSLAYGFIQKIRSRDKTTAASSVTQQRDEPAVQPAKDIVPSTAAAPTDAEQDKINADRLLAERATQEQKAADEAKLAAQKAADDPKLLAEQKKVNQPDQSKLVPEPEAVANAKTQEEPKTRSTHKQAEKAPQSSGHTRTSTASQSASHPAPVAPPTHPPPAPRPANNPQRPKSEFGPSAPGG
jgi:hypothetical protein